VGRPAGDHRKRRATGPRVIAVPVRSRPRTHDDGSDAPDGGEQDRFARNQTIDRQPAPDIAAFHVAHLRRAGAQRDGLDPPGVRRDGLVIPAPAAALTWLDCVLIRSSLEARTNVDGRVARGDQRSRSIGDRTVGRRSVRVSERGEAGIADDL